MCGRFTQQRPTAELAELFDAEPQTPDAGGHYNVAPTQQVNVVVQPAADAPRVLDAYRWGLVPTWADDPRIGNRLINARAETVATSPAFRRSFTGRRCIVPADAFYEWQRVGEKTRRPFLIRRRDGAPLAFAGLWSTWRDEAHDAWLRSFTIITTDANRLMAQLHDRMPVVLEPRDWAAWLDPEVHDADRLRAMLHPAAEGVLEAYAVSPLVNSPRNLGPELIRPVDDEVLRD